MSKWKSIHKAGVYDPDASKKEPRIVSDAQYIYEGARDAAAVEISTKNVFHSEGGGEFVAAGTIVDPDMRDAAVKCSDWSRRYSYHDDAVIAELSHRLHRAILALDVALDDTGDQYYGNVRDQAKEALAKFEAVKGALK